MAETVTLDLADRIRCAVTSLRMLLDVRAAIGLDAVLTEHDVNAAVVAWTTSTLDAECAPDDDGTCLPHADAHAVAEGIMRKLAAH